MQIKKNFTEYLIILAAAGSGAVFRVRSPGKRKALSLADIIAYMQWPCKTKYTPAGTRDMFKTDSPGSVFKKQKNGPLGAVFLFFMCWDHSKSSVIPSMRKEKEGAERSVDSRKAPPETASPLSKTKSPSVSSAKALIT